MSYANPTFPNLADFMAFAYGPMQINPLFLPNDSAAFNRPFYRAQALTINVPGVNAYDYTDAVYNCAGHILIATSPDQNGRTFFADLRAKYGLTGGLAAGVVSATSDASTSTSLAVPEGLANLTISDLGFFKTPWGRTFLEFNQDFGGVWGLS